ncbi:MAG: hypothetical protein PVG41_16955 [Desulfobacteraceae bacterium]|jgi:hypothetical protein
MATHYKIGTVDPVIRHDPGAGMWNSKPKTQKMSILKSEIRGHLPHAFLIIGDDAARHMNHYFKNTGKDYVIDLQDMIDDVPDAKVLYDREVTKAKRFVGTLSELKLRIVSWANFTGKAWPANSIWSAPSRHLLNGTAYLPAPTR